LIRRWIEQGAKWQQHWSRIIPQRAELPQVTNASWPRNPIDRFILARLEQEGLKPSPEAESRTLIRRLSFDLTGLPPTPEEVDAFVNDNSPTAYEKLVDRLLGSKHYGERMAIYWLDLVRYADTGGYHSDNHRDVWLYRDYVIDAFNDNKRFDQFTIEQLAGDLLPNATRKQKIASGYNRMLQTTEEGGAQPKEYAAKYAADRVRNVSSVWLASTMGCSECHDHKFDPFSTKEFYRFASFFADLQELPVGRQPQTPVPTPDQEAQLKKLDEQMAPLQKVLATQTPELDAAQAKWEASLPLAEVRKLPKPVIDILLIDPAKRTPPQKQAVAAHYRTVAPQLAAVRKQLAALQKQRDDLNKTIPTTLISISGPPRVMRVLPRGNWLSDAGEVVTPGVPAVLNKLDTKDRPTRLDLAKWLVAPDNPLVAHVFVNRLWKLLFGQGIVKSLEDFGSQGAWPTHPELLDWLAVEFRESGWNIKHIVKLMVMSATYRQSSALTEEVRQRDPYNLLLARQGRFRLDAEVVRDNALAVSGLLSRQIGGPSVKPYQPAGYWAYLNFPKRDWEKDQGPNQYRRGLYTYWCRTFLHPSMLAFDASTREECMVERPRSNTPLQALVLLNDPTYVEAARALAERVMREGGQSADERVEFAYRQVLQRKARPEEVQLLTGLLARHQKQYQVDKSAAAALLKVGDKPVPKDIDAAELAAWTSVARVVLNLHETVTRN
ncbi:MAG TPA: DUF1549 and DUF1553 domain-containing protein, partial [Gemmataceae bacterium]|nr:DUF1549 and DUF1553 domain-containing protein [Gemmataceae bacterium]